MRRVNALEIYLYWFPRPVVIAGYCSFIAADVAPSSIITHTRARRATRDRVPTGRLNTNDVLAAAKQVEQNTSANTATVAATTTTATTTTIADPIPRVSSHPKKPILSKILEHMG